jgi:hypothetical protein
MFFWLQAPLELLLSVERTFWDFCDATVWFDVSYHSNVPSEPSFRVAPFAASHRPVEDRLALGRRAWRTPEKLPSVSFDTFAHARNGFVRLRSGNSAEIKECS